MSGGNVDNSGSCDLAKRVDQAKPPESKEETSSPLVSYLSSFDPEENEDPPCGVLSVPDDILSTEDKKLVDSIEQLVSLQYYKI